MNSAPAKIINTTIDKSNQFTNKATNPMDAFVTVAEMKEEARKKLPKMVYDYYASGSNDQSTLAENENAFTRIKLVPRSLVNVSKVSTKTKIYGQDLSTPIMIAPWAMQRMAHPNGELDTLEAAKEFGTIMTLSSLSTTSVEDVSKHSNGNPGWFQLYVFKDRKVSEDLVKRVEKLGYKALVVTVDTPFLGKRDADYKNQFKLPNGLFLKNFEHLLLSNLEGGLNQYMATMIDPGLTWKDLEWLRSITTLPVLVKGVMCPQDAAEALKHGADGIIVSNHGGRQLDTSPSTIEVLPAISKVVQGKIPLILDGGIRRGTDILKALAFGANAVLIGRPVIWGLSCGGKDGVLRVLNLLNSELQLSMAFTGMNSIHEITENIIWDQNKYIKL
ncbi:hypothetical protein DICPUDRAFT_97074 [Dictyostelium purpureum]|uniref:FMN hydroxy acid dehydrogenase domain-containing protein n=1 Tax=Dictyostelium purpureum TaxID=5786 RepID=F0ZDN7_DICPU|nr:uncharacterized protein DICPUDRAFT_97074 [Dictyostelium purpureum]EGC37948.1 hypothetical protein DICPUDRAFT_97074 [Dictyostelium purpureum]|eukprot:XP_003285519.1 hypothetical protein DICPUDRAFT_97074 [Dictyostelium purpureum]